MNNPYTFWEVVACMLGSMAVGIVFGWVTKDDLRYWWRYGRHDRRVRQVNAAWEHVKETRKSDLLALVERDD